MSEVKVLGMICQALELPEGALAMETAIANVEEWDSVGWLTVMALVDEEYGLQLNGRTIRSMMTAGDLVAFILKQSKATA